MKPIDSKVFSIIRNRKISSKISWNTIIDRPWRKSFQSPSGFRGTRIWPCKGWLTRVQTTQGGINPIKTRSVWTELVLLTGEPDSVETVDSELIPSVTTIQDNPDSVKLSELCARFITNREEMGTTSQTISGYIYSTQLLLWVLFLQFYWFLFCCFLVVIRLKQD